MQRVTFAALSERLTPRQLEVLGLIAQRFSSKEAGRHLGLSPKTIDRHVEEINEKLGVSYRSEAGRIYLQALSEHGEQLPMGMAAFAAEPVSGPDMAQPEGEALPTRTEPELHQANGFVFLLGRLFTLPPVGGKRHDMTLTKRLASVGQISLISILVMAAIITVITGILHLLGR